MPLARGSRLGPYEILSALGAGGMGEVYRARDTKLGRDVAIKILPPHFIADPERRARFTREARLLATLNHPHIAAIYGLEECEGVTALVLELVEGPTLAERLERGPLPLAEALAIARQMADALDEAHEKGIVHRDLKPANIVLRGTIGPTSGDVRAKVLDFGIAKTLSASSGNDVTAPSGSVDGTAEGRILGTPAYMSPEQARGLLVDKRTDIWAFGCVLFEMLTGRRAFEGDTAADTFGYILEREPDWSLLPGDTPAPVRTLLERCLRKDPRKRLHDIADVRIEGEDPGQQSNTSSRTRFNGRERFVWAAVCAALALLALAGGLAFVRGAGDRSGPAVGPVRFPIQTPDGSRLPTGAMTPFALSPSSAQLVFSARSADDGLLRLWMRSLATEGSQAIPGTEGGDYPAWSPDNRFVAFCAGGKLKKISIAGGPATDIGDVPELTGVSWGITNGIVYGSHEGLRLVNADGGGQPTPLTKVDRTRGELSHVWPQFLPDGRHVLFTSLGTKTEIRVVSLESHDVVTVIEAPSKAIYASGYLLFVRDTSLVAQPFDLKALHLSAGALSLSDIPVKRAGLRDSENTTGLYTAFAASDTGVLVFAEEASPGISRLTWLDSSGRAVGTVGAPAEYAFMSLSPDGQRVAYVLGADWAYNRDNGLWLADVADGSVHRLTSEQGTYSLPVWSPSGDRLAYNVARGPEVELVVRGALASAPEDVIVRDVSSKLGHWVSDWSIEQNALLVTVGVPSQGQALEFVSLSGDREPTRFITEPISGSAAVLSPDRKWIAYHAKTDRRPEVYVRPFPVVNNEVHQISSNGGHNAKWRPGDGHELFYVGLDGRMMSATIDTSKGFEIRTKEAFAVPAGRATGGYFQQYDVTRDGRVLMIVSDQELTKLTSRYISGVLNWPALLRGR
jgi:serine/threonine protein kinase